MFWLEYDNKRKMYDGPVWDAPKFAEKTARETGTLTRAFDVQGRCVYQVHPCR